MTEARSYASVDIGSHTVRLLVASHTGGDEIVPVRSERRVTRLARNYQRGEMLGRETMQETIRVLEEYRRLMDEHRVDAVTAGATGVVRRALNAEPFLRAIREKTGIDVRILSESEEAFFSAKGILSAFPKLPDVVLAFDLGGSSTELLLVDPSLPNPIWSTSVFIGAATITERFLRGDPTEKSSLLEAEVAARDALGPTLSTLEARMRENGIRGSNMAVIGTAGTVTTLAAMLIEMVVYQPYRVSGLKIESSRLDDIIHRLAGMPIASRSNLPGLESGREDIILGGALIVREILKGTQKESLMVSDAGLLEGLLLYCMENEYNWPHTLGSHLTWRWERE